jgi:hypothetical protein
MKRKIPESEKGMGWFVKIQTPAERSRFERAAVLAELEAGMDLTNRSFFKAILEDYISRRPFVGLNP